MRKYARNLKAAYKHIANEIEARREIKQPISKNPLHGVITPEVMANIRSRNDARLKKTLKEMGNKWICHETNRVPRKDGKVYSFGN
jgi:hypothetical protein